MAHWWTRTGLYPDLSITLDLEFDCVLDAERLAKALDLVIAAQPVLGCRLETRGRRPYWEQIPSTEWNSFRVAKSRSEVDAFRHSGIDSERESQLHGCLLTADSGSRLVLKMSHQAGDAAGLREVAYQLAACYSGLAENSNYRPESAAPAGRSLAAITGQLSWKAYPALLKRSLDYVRKVNHSGDRLGFSRGPATPWTNVRKRICAEETQRLAAYAHDRDATMNDLLIASFLKASARKAGRPGESSQNVLITVDLRRYLPDGGVSTIANMSGGELLSVRSQPETPLEQILKDVGRQTRSLRQHFIGMLAVSMNALFEASVSLWGFNAISRPPSPRKLARAPIVHVLSNVGAFEGARLAFDGLPPRSGVCADASAPAAGLCCDFDVPSRAARNWRPPRSHSLSRRTRFHSR